MREVTTSSKAEGKSAAACKGFITFFALWSSEEYQDACYDQHAPSHEGSPCSLAPPATQVEALSREKSQVVALRSLRCLTHTFGLGAIMRP